MPQLDGSVFVSGSYIYTFIVVLLIILILTGALSNLKFAAVLKNFYSFKKLNLLNVQSYKKCY